MKSKLILILLLAGLLTGCAVMTPEFPVMTNPILVPLEHSLCQVAEYDSVLARNMGICIAMYDTLSNELKREPSFFHRPEFIKDTTLFAFLDSTRDADAEIMMGLAFIEIDQDSAFTDTVSRKVPMFRIANLNVPLFKWTVNEIPLNSNYRNYLVTHVYCYTINRTHNKKRIDFYALALHTQIRNSQPIVNKVEYELKDNENFEIPWLLCPATVIKSRD